MTKKLKEFLPSIIAVLIALTIGGIIMISKGVNPLFAYSDMAKAAFYQASPRAPFLSGLAKTLFTATPLIFSALAAMVAFKAGLFNIGAQGQMIAGGLAATFWAITFRNYILGNVFIVLIIAMAAGFLWAGIAGFLKSRFGVNEVISTIMLNYIIIEFQNYLLNGILKDPASGSTQSPKVFEGARLPLIFAKITKQNLNLGFVIVILLVIGIYFFFKYFKKGYEIKAVGLSETVAENSGINPKKIMFLAMGLAGICAGLGGAERVLGGSAQYAYTEVIMGDAGFTGLAVALLGKNSPFGILIAGIFYAALDVGGQALQLKYQVDKEIVLIIQALIIIFVASENLFKFFTLKRKEK
ncbi:ABC transporter permease [Leptotrichia sp. OH3620_COT-345]|uniref:ABC transporter permease n=1 Tax=Leptotrichia sp. OH3620_COT-345 TaxID=2491048 RepID=UPI000F65491E|nr:ABC transporter permease [Leptotrichia sp. OH3620_COT-345]RRD41018.1 ABC transporter permease [Leptotrichia sp. OH3620_COT-345]